MSDRFEAAVSLLEKFEFYTMRLKLRADAPLEPEARVIVVKILVEMLHTFATLT